METHICAYLHAKWRQISVHIFLSNGDKYSTHAALQLPKSPLLLCHRNISFTANSYPLKRWKFYYFDNGAVTVVIEQDCSVDPKCPLNVIL